MTLGFRGDSDRFYSASRPMALSSSANSSAYAYNSFSQPSAKDTLSVSNGNFDELCRKARTLESDLDSKLVQFSKLGAAYNQPRANRFSSQQSSASRSATDAEQEYKNMSVEVDELLGKLARLNDAMQSSADQQSANVPSRASTLHAVQRHQDILSDYRGEFEKTKVNFAMLRSRSELRVVNAATRATGETTAEPASAYYQSLDMEHLKNSDRQLDGHVALGTKEHPSAQRVRLSPTQHRLDSIVSRVSFLNALLSKINLRRRKDCLLMSFVTSLCFFALLFYVFG